MRRSILITALFVLLAFPGGTAVAGSGLIEEFRGAVFKYDPKKITSIVEDNRVRIPEEINSYLDETVKADLSKEEKEERYYVLERLATEYKNVTGDFAVLKETQKRIFESRLSSALESRATGGVHVVETLSAGEEKNIFKPDNIIIRKGETVRWVNNDSARHLLASVLTSVGSGGIFSPNLAPGDSWEFTFKGPGDYFYICFIHKVMYGKVTVVE